MPPIVTAFVLVAYYRPDLKCSLMKPGPVMLSVGVYVAAGASDKSRVDQEQEITMLKLVEVSGYKVAINPEQITRIKSVGKESAVYLADGGEQPLEIGVAEAARFFNDRNDKNDKNDEAEE